jgi:hypothetical protein
MRIGMFGVIAAALPLLAGLVGCASSGDLPTARVDARAEAVTGSPLRVVTANGHITVRPGSGDAAEIRAEIKATTPERLAATTISTERAPDGALVIAVAWPDGVREPREGCSLDITIPPAEGVELRTSNGRITVEGMGGAAELSTTNGAIEVRRQRGEVRADTRNGEVRIDSPGGMVRVRSGNAAVTVKGAPAAVDVETTNGAVEVALAPQSQGPVRVLTQNGRIDLRLGEAFRGELALKAANGAVKFDGVGGAQVLSSGGQAARLRFGEGGEMSIAQTSNGSIRISGGPAGGARAGIVE